MTNSFCSVTGSPEVAEPSSASSTTSTTPTPTPAPSQPADMRPHTKTGPRSLNVSGSPSAANSPKSSRNTSPIRPAQNKSGRPSRKNSNDASPSRGSSTAGPSSTSIPSAAAIQRALSSASIPQLPSPSSTQDSSRVPRPSKSTSRSNSGDTTPYGPTSPRLKSPPPPEHPRSRSRQSSLRNAQQYRKPEPAATPSIIVLSSSPGPASRAQARDDVVGSDPEEPHLSMKPSGRGAAPKLETVQESSVPSTPSEDDAHSLLSSSVVSNTADEDQNNDVTSSKITEDLSARAAKKVDNGSDGGTRNKSKMQEQRSVSTQRPTGPTPKPSLSSLHTVKSRTDPPLRNMTVETETVPSVAQTAIGNQDRSASGRGDGSLRLKPSNETIRPRKERKPAKRKAQSIHSGTGRSPVISHHHHHPSKPELGPRPATASSFGSPVSYRSSDRSTLTLSPPRPEMTRRRAAQSPSFPFPYLYPATNTRLRKASSKADVFEQKVASEVNEADSSDSDATFIYESNPPDHGPHRSRQHGQHSRTPSMTSIVSLVDPRLAIRNEHKNPDKKPSMKFPNPYNNGNGEYDGNGDGTVRAGSARSGGSRHHHHIGRHSQTRGGLHHLVMDSDSSLVGSSRIRAPSSRHPSQPNSPRFQTFNVINGTGNGNGNGTRKQGELSTYEIDTENAADDERTPLIQVRSPRVRGSRHGRPGSATLRHLEHRNRRRGEGNWCRRFAGCLVASVIILVVVFTAVGVVFASTKQLTDLKISEIQNVVASQEEIIMDLVVGAVNPNIIGITVSDMDILMFAKSKHVGSDQWWREHGDGTPKNEEGWLPIQPSSRSKDQLDIAGVDEGTDPAEEPHTMWLGQIDHFDSPLTFDGTFFNHRRIESVGEIRLSKPGNKTEAGGTARWEEVLQYPFELIVRGTLKYELPLSTHVHKVSVTASYEYDPDAEKKKLKLMGSKSVKEKRRNLSSLPVISAPVGRYDRRMLPHLSWPFAR